MWGGCGRADDRAMPQFRLHHRHDADECPAVYAAWKGFDSPLRHQPTTSSCQRGGHEIWWDVSATNPADALSQLPDYVAARTTAIRVDPVDIP